MILVSSFEYRIWFWISGELAGGEVQYKLNHISLVFVANLPPTLAKSQVSSVRKNLKLHLMAVLKHPCSLEFQGQISTLLLDLGMSQNEITRNTPAPREPRKRPRHEPYTEGKKLKIG